MSDYYSRETGFDALCRIMAERHDKPLVINMVRHNGETAIKSAYAEYENKAISEWRKKK